MIFDATIKIIYNINHVGIYFFREITNTMYQFQEYFGD